MRRTALSFFTLVPLLLTLQGCPVWGSGTDFGCITKHGLPQRSRL